jgi:hypothetical protein
VKNSRIGHVIGSAGLSVSPLGREICAVSFGFIASLIIVILAVLSVFVEIQIVTNYAFWLVIGTYIMLAGACFD